MHGLIGLYVVYHGSYFTQNKQVLIEQIDVLPSKNQVQYE